MRHVVIIFILVIVLGAVGFLYWQQQQNFLPLPYIAIQSSTPLPSPQPKVDEKTVRNSFGSQILDKTQNPLQDKVPQANPYQNTQTNPLKNIYKNPF